ncbi:hypothetical protein SUDANB15_03440 [Streptomyces sp. enrichment culture]|uniref:hypothetical protein n=1 Tax=Streptomyces sp. enrichment culture TaxID=1795815 RepID=UPI003F56C357
MNRAQPAAPVRDMRTGRLHTRVYRSGDHHLWRREVLRDGVPARSLPSLPTDTGLAPAELAKDGAYEYRVAGGLSLGHLLWPPTADAAHGAPLSPAMTNTGRALRSLHAQGPVLAGPAPVPPPVTRLARWLRSADDHAHHRLTAVLGPARLRELSAWCDVLVTPASAPPHTLLHGEPSVGLIIPCPAPTHAVLLTGETLSHGPAAFDTGWLIGELAEMARLSGPAHAPLFATLATALLAGYGPLTSDDIAPLRLAAGLRSVVHVADYATYVGWADGLEHCIALLPDLVDTSGQAALDAVAVSASTAAPGGQPT